MGEGLGCCVLNKWSFDLSQDLEERPMDLSGPLWCRFEVLEAGPS